MGNKQTIWKYVPTKRNTGRFECVACHSITKAQIPAIIFMHLEAGDYVKIKDGLVTEVTEKAKK